MRDEGLEMGRRENNCIPLFRNCNRDMTFISIYKLPEVYPSNSGQAWLKTRHKSILKHIGVNRPAIVREIPHFGLFPVFLREHPAFLALFRNKKIAENRNNFSCTETFC